MVVNLKFTNGTMTPISTLILMLIIVTLSSTKVKTQQPTEMKTKAAKDQSDCLLDACLFRGCQASQICVTNKDCIGVCVDINTSETTPSVPTSAVKSTPAHRTDCSENFCQGPNICTTNQDCAMKYDCSGYVCVDKDISTDTTTTVGTPASQKTDTTTTVGTPASQNSDTTTTVGTPASQNSDTTTTFGTTNDDGVRNDCEIDYCPFFDVNCLSNQICAMNQYCNDTVCVNINTPTSTTDRDTTTTVGTLVSQKTDTTNVRNDCEIDYCPFFAVNCLSNQICAMNQYCNNTVCVNINTPTSTTDRGNVTAVTGSHPATTLRPLDERICYRGIVCEHGYCDKSAHACVCDEGWQKIRCHVPCTLQCVHGNCYVDQQGHIESGADVKTQCNCNSAWEGELCDQLKPDLAGQFQKKTLVLGLSLGAVILVILVVSIFILIVLWRRRVIVVMKLIYLFKLEEDNDGRIYDAYVSMGSSLQGIEFVKDELCPMLGRLGFTAYVQARDMIPGTTLTENITKSIRESRRTILIITPEYIGNEWGTFECLIAQVETLKQQHRIIPIILQEISPELRNSNKTLKSILESVKCLKFPTMENDQRLSPKDLAAKKERKERKFWKRLELTMPKKSKTQGLHFDKSVLPNFDSKNVESINIEFTSLESFV